MRIFIKISCFLFSVWACAQAVGINTVVPRKTLEVAGDVNVSGALDLRNFENLQDIDTNTFLKQENDGYITGLNVSNPTGAALAYIQEYEISDMDGDWILDFDTTIDASEYVVVPVSANFNQDLAVSNDNNEITMFSIQYCSTYTDNGTWHIIADYPVSDVLDSSTTVAVWKITTLIFSRNLSKQFGVTEFDLNNTTSGAAVTPIVD